MVSTDPVRIASRGSELALWQANEVGRALRETSPAGQLEVEVRVIRTTGDRIQDVPLSWIGDRGLFTREIDDSLLRREADLAVHSLKDVPTQLPEGLVLAAVTRREDPRDVVLRRGDEAGALADLPDGARVGTSSLRRAAQLRARRADLQPVDLRGNLNTRLARLDAGEYDAILLAAAGVLRLGWRDRISAFLEIEEWLPAPGQGALAIVIRSDDAALGERLRPLHDREAGDATTAERALLAALEGGCQVPIGALARVDGEGLILQGLVAALDGSLVLRGETRGPRSSAAELGRSLADELLSQGAGRILEEIRADAAVGMRPAPAP